jgi:hypothetical protein
MANEHDAVVYTIYVFTKNVTGDIKRVHNTHASILPVENKSNSVGPNFFSFFLFTAKLVGIGPNALASIQYVQVQNQRWMRVMNLQK